MAGLKGCLVSTEKSRIHMLAAHVSRGRKKIHAFREVFKSACGWSDGIRPACRRAVANAS